MDHQIVPELDQLVQSGLSRVPPVALDSSRAKKLQNQHAREQERIQRPLRFEEIEVRRRAKGAATYAAYLQDALDEAESPEHRKDLERLLHHFAGATEADWRRWFDVGRSLTEEEVYELAGPPKPEKSRQPTPEELCAMVRRVIKEPEMPKVPKALVAPRPAQAEGETEDDRLLRERYRGDVVLFEAVLGRKPNQENPAGSRPGKRRRRRNLVAGAIL
ncbi:hypothetical protein [Streptomyces capoamus]|uniref:hypothetical protein n=1 Tax=Streptomyces capoamus TaxID=68183 RepID=UPI0033952F96